MKLTVIFALFALIVMVKGTWWAAAVQPFILSLGAILGTIDSDVLNVESIEWRNLLPFINKQEEEKNYDMTAQQVKEEQENEPKLWNDDNGICKRLGPDEPPMEYEEPKEDDHVKKYWKGKLRAEGIDPEKIEGGMTEMYLLEKFGIEGYIQAKKDLYGPDAVSMV